MIFPALSSALPIVRMVPDSSFADHSEPNVEIPEEKQHEVNIKDKGPDREDLQDDICMEMLNDKSREFPKKRGIRNCAPGYIVRVWSWCKEFESVHKAGRRSVARAAAAEFRVPETTIGRWYFK